MYPRTWITSDRPAVVMGGSGAATSYAELDAASTRLARFFRDRELRPGDVVAMVLENGPLFHVVAWAARRSGLYFAAVNRHLTQPEIAYIVADSGARAVVTSRSLAPTTAGVPAGVRLMAAGTVEGWESYEDATAGFSDEPLADEQEGDLLQYSSGTTGRPKGIRRALSGKPISLEGDPTVMFLRAVGFPRGASTSARRLFTTPRPPTGPWACTGWAAPSSSWSGSTPSRRWPSSSGTG